MLNEEELKDAALLVFANKQDQPGAKGAGDISQALRLGELRDRNWSIMACSAVDGSGVSEGMDWLVVSSGSLGLLKVGRRLTAAANRLPGLKLGVVFTALENLQARSAGQQTTDRQPGWQAQLSNGVYQGSEEACLMTGPQTSWIAW